MMASRQRGPVAQFDQNRLAWPQAGASMMRFRDNTSAYAEPDSTRRPRQSGPQSAGLLPLTPPHPHISADLLVDALVTDMLRIGHRETHAGRHPRRRINEVHIKRPAIRTAPDMGHQSRLHLTRPRVIVRIRRLIRTLTSPPHSHSHIHPNSPFTKTVTSLYRRRSILFCIPIPIWVSEQLYYHN